ncbi:MAG: hypothetical protein K2K20_07230 [Lachnospiraceae bacterium]|nr:hypothetical protein [Lachnospiraceae bacterium]
MEHKSSNSKKENKLQDFFGLDGPFSNFMNTLGNIIWTGLLWLVTSIPLITMGCSAMGAFRASEKTRKNQGYITKEFFTGFVSDWKTALPMQIVNLIFFAWLIFDCIYLYGYEAEYALVISYVLYGILFFALGLNCYYYPCLGVFEGNFFEIFKIAFYMTFRHLLTTIALVGLIAAAVLVVYLMPWSIMIVPGLWWYAADILIQRVIRKEIGETV